MAGLMWGPGAPSEAAEAVNPLLLDTQVTAHYKPSTRGFYQCNFIPFVMNT